MSELTLCRCGQLLQMCVKCKDREIESLRSELRAAREVLEEHKYTDECGDEEPDVFEAIARIDAILSPKKSGERGDA